MSNQEERITDETEFGAFGFTEIGKGTRCAFSAARSDLNGMDFGMFDIRCVAALHPGITIG